MTSERVSNSEAYVNRSTSLAANRAKQESVGHEVLREAIGQPPAKLRPSGVEERVRRNGSEVDDIDLGPGPIVEAIGQGGVDVRLDPVEEQMGVLRAKPRDVLRIDSVAHGGGERIHGGDRLRIAAILLPAPDQIDEDGAFVD